MLQHLLIYDLIAIKRKFFEQNFIVFVQLILWAKSKFKFAKSVPYF